MKLKPYHIAFFLFFGTVGLTDSANAQEAAYTERDEDRLNYTYEKGDEYSSETNQERSTTTNRVANSNTNHSAKSSVKEEEEDENVLSFNFLYYIIQRYKMSDIVEQKK